MSAEPEGRAVLIARLRELATWLEDHPAIPLAPHVTVDVNYFTDDPEEARAAISDAAPSSRWGMDVLPESDYWIYEYGYSTLRWGVRYRINVRKPKPEPES